MPHGNRIELWLWEHDHLDIEEHYRAKNIGFGKFYTGHSRQVWAVEFDDNGITGAFGPCFGSDKIERIKDLIIRKSGVITTMEKRRNEFKRIARVAA